MELHHSQNKIAADTHRFRVLNCGRRFGKTTLAIEEIKGVALSKSTRIAYIATTYAQARDIAWEMLKKEMQGAIIQANESRLELRTKNQIGTESLIVLRGWENIETLRGLAFDFIVIDEVASMRNFILHWQEVVRPTLTDTKGEGLFISTPQGFNHFYDLYNLEQQDRDFKSFHFTSYDNPYIPKDEIDKAKKELTEDRFAQEYLADFRKTQGLVYKEFDRQRHTYSDNKVNEIERFIGIDWGYTNPAGVLLVQKDNDNHFWIPEEYYKSQKTTAEIIEYALNLRGFKYYPDPAEPDRNEELKRAGAHIQEVSKDVEAGINAVRELFKQNRIHISINCPYLINELETYRYPEKKPDKNEYEQPIKENDHLCDALRYVLYNQSAYNQSKTKIIIPNWVGYNKFR